MKTTKRSKMLLSSIAMLLVALVALGSASFAWYYTVQSVSAETTQFNAAAADGLVIRHHTGDAWKTALNTANSNALDTASSLQPASISYGAIGSVFGGYGVGKAFDDGEISTAGLNGVTNANVLKTQAETNGYYLVDEMWVATQSSATNKTATFTVTGTSRQNSYLNVAIYINGTLEKVYTSDDADSTYKVEGNATNPTTSATASQTLVPFTGNSQQVTASMPVGSNYNQSLATACGTHIQIIAFVDGYNENCKSSSVDIHNVSVTYNFQLNA